MLILLGLGDAWAQVRVKGYTRKDGTYVAPHYRSSPNSSKHDNYSTRGNYNPYTGKKGSVDPYNQPYTGSSYIPSAVYVAPGFASVTSAPTPVASTPSTFWRRPASAPAPTIREISDDEGLEAVRVLGKSLQETDPYWGIRYPQISGQLAAISSAYPPSQWASEVERLYWSIPALKSSRLPKSAPVLVAGQWAPSSYACDAAEDARQALSSAASELTDCADQRDYSNDCSMEASDVRDAADAYEGAVADLDGDCY